MPRKNIPRLISAVVLTVLLLTAPAAANPARDAVTPPRNAAAAISAALERDAELAELRTRERNTLARLAQLRTDPSSAPDAETAELISDAHRLWASYNARSREITAEVLITAMAIDTELNRLREIGEMLDEMAVWLEAAETDFRTSRIDAATLGRLRDRRDEAQNDLTASGLMLSTHRNRFREFTGHFPPESFDYGSAWLLTDINIVDVSQLPARRPAMLFDSIDGVAAPAAGAASAEPLINNALLALMSLHEAVGRYARADAQRNEAEERFKRGELGRYALYDAEYERRAARTDVFEWKYAYAAEMLELDKNTGGVISSGYRARPAEWFYEDDWVFGGRLGAEYAWTEEAGGQWRLESADGMGEIMFVIHEVWPRAGNAARAEIYYGGDMLAGGGVNEQLTFSPPEFDGGSLFEVVFYDRGGEETGRAFIDGFANAGRFFLVVEPAEEIPEEEDEDLDNDSDPDDPDEAADDPDENGTDDPEVPDAAAGLPDE